MSTDVLARLINDSMAIVAPKPEPPDDVMAIAKLIAPDDTVAMAKFIGSMQPDGVPRPLAVRVGSELYRLSPAAEIHTTDVETFAQCRRRWNWQSQLRQGLQRASLPPALMLGQGVHIGLDAYWTNKRDVAVAISTFDQWIDKRAKDVEEWSKAPLWQSERVMFQENKKLGQMMLLHYHLWCDDFDKEFEVIATEHKFDLPLPRPDGSLSSDLMLSGRFDGVARRRSDGALYLLEFKTSAKLANVKWMFRGLQGSVYTWAARQLYPDVQGILYQVLRKKIPTQPKPLQRGGFSRAKGQAKSTSYAFYMHCLKKMAEKSDDSLESLTAAAHDALILLSGMPNPFFFQADKSRPQSVIDNAMKTMYYLAKQMVDPSTPIFSMSSHWCGNCAFKDPCQLFDEGGDWQGLLEAEYAPRTYWEKS